MIVVILLWCVAVFLVLVPAAVLVGRSRHGSTLVYGASFIVAAIAFGVALADLVAEQGQPSAIILPLGLPWIGAHFRIDALSAFFLVVVNLGAAGASLYAIGYGRHEHAPLRVLPFFPAFLAGMNLVVLADDAFSFLLSWEFMSLTSWALVVSHDRVADNVKAGYVYILMASFGTFALLLAFGLLAGTDGNYAFDVMRGNLPSTVTAIFVLALALIGAGSKAGLVPLHAWLPLAHPAAPSHVSALMSGVMTKVAIYGFIRIVFDLLGPPEWWWGLVVLILGGATAAMGVLYALMQNDLKRVLAYSTIENIGFIFVGLGLALAFSANQLQAAAVLAFTAALFHVFNHALFKSLLFFGSGAILTATGERDMEKLGGLIHRMPVTAFACLVGCAAISALPPLNGFVSEWLIFQAILLSPDMPQWGLRLIIPAVGALLALAVALAGACFVRVFGIAFLGRARSPMAESAKDSDPFSLAAMLSFAALCLVAGILPGFGIDAIGAASQAVLGAHMPSQAAVPWLSIVPIAESRSSYNGLLVFVFVALSASLTAYAIHVLGNKTLRRAPPWDCGFPDASPLIQYSAGSFAQPIRRVFGTLVFRAREHVDMPRPGDNRPARLRVELHDVIWDRLYVPLAGGVGFIATRLNVLQFLTIRRYLSLVFLTLVALLLVLAVWS
ncbi:MAG TPA: hydrogenase 4 subunit B [Micropepsaceae bacterium]|nr:hydrogenase 4 subunit B [Micropepsaceae bacterium]